MSALAIIGWVMTVGAAFVMGLRAGANAALDPADVQELRAQLVRAHADRCALIDDRDRIAARLTAISGSLRGGLS
jgi:hypothetical protein